MPTKYSFSTIICWKNKWLSILKVPYKLLSHLKWKLLLLSTHFNNFILGAFQFNFNWVLPTYSLPLAKYC